MQKKISIEQLRVGMYVTKLDRSWTATPFWRHKMHIETPDHIEALRACGVQSIEIDTAKGLDVVSQGSAHAVAPPSALAEESSPSWPSQSQSQAIPFDDELNKAKEAYVQAKAAVSQAMHAAWQDQALDVETVSGASEKLVESILHNGDALASLSRLKSFDEYTFFHSVNMTILTLAMGRQHGMPRATLSKLGLGALLHDIGKMRVPLDLLNAPRRLEENEREVIKQHVMRGAEYLSRHATLPEETLRPLLEHHERPDGTGYPAGRNRTNLSQSGLIASVADIYDAMTSDRVYRKGLPPHQALRHVQGLALDGQLDPRAVRGLIQCLGLYPVGSCVRLSTGEIGVVSRPSTTDPLKPTLLLVSNGGGLYRPPKPFDLAEQSRPARYIVTPVDPHEVGIDPGQVLGGLDT